MSQDEFTKLFKYVSEHFEAIDKKLDDKASQASIDKLTNTIDGFVSRTITIKPRW